MLPRLQFPSTSRLLILIFLVSCLSPICSAEPSDPAVDWDKYDARLEQQLKTEPGIGDGEIYQVIGMTHAQMNQWPRALVWFRKAVAADPGLYMSWYYLGLSTPDTPYGENYFRKAIQTNPAYPPPRYWLGYILVRHYRDQEAIEVLEAYLKIADGWQEEAARIQVAERILKELHSRLGAEIARIRLPRKEAR